MWERRRRESLRQVEACENAIHAIHFKDVSNRQSNADRDRRLLCTSQLICDANACFRLRKLVLPTATFAASFRLESSSALCPFTAHIETATNASQRTKFSNSTHIRAIIKHAHRSARNLWPLGEKNNQNECACCMQERHFRSKRNRILWNKTKS